MIRSPLSGGNAGLVVVVPTADVAVVMALVVAAVVVVVVALVVVVVSQEVVVPVGAASAVNGTHTVTANTTARMIAEILLVCFIRFLSL